MENYQKKLDDIINTIGTGSPSLLLHACCAPCSSYVLEYLSQYFSITVFFYNPNISPESEYRKRTLELVRLIHEMPTKKPISFLEGNYEPERFYAMVKGLENLPEGGDRCVKCYELRMREAAEVAKLHGFDFFTTTLSISPHKNAQKLNEIGKMLENEFHVKYLYADFKKKEGYKRSIVLSKQYELYRQDYCGCIFSKIKTGNT